MLNIKPNQRTRNVPNVLGYRVQLRGHGLAAVIVHRVTRPDHGQPHVLRHRPRQWVVLKCWS